MASFSDDFNRADSTDLGAGWVEVSGDWSIVSGQLAPDASSGNTILRAAAPMASSDHYAQFTIAATTAASQGVWCRGDGTLSSGYLWRNNGSSWDLFAVAGGFTAIGTYAAAVAPGDVARVQAVGSTIKGFVNGIERVSVLNTAVPSGTNVGLRVMALPGLRFDNFAAADATSGVTATLPVAGALEATQSLAAGKSSPFIPAVEMSSAQSLVGAKTATLPPAVELNSPQNLAGAKTAVFGTAATLEAAQPLAAAMSDGLPSAIMVEAAQPLVGTKAATLPPALEVSTAYPLARQSAVTPSPERTVQVPAEGRQLVVAADSRTMTVR